jgi:hypothetical protein
MIMGMMMSKQRYKVIYNEDGEGARISDEIKEEWLFPEGCVDLLNGCEKSLSERDKKITELESQQCDLVFAILSIEHKKGGSLGADGQLYYRVPESLFKKAKAIKESK